MNPIIHSYVIDLQNKYNRIRQYEIKQFDTDSHKFAFTLLDSSVAYNLTGLTGKIYIKKPNGQEVFSNLTIDSATGGKLSFLLTTQCLTVPGTVEAEITLYGTSGEVLTSITFTYIVKQLLRDDESIESTNEYTALTEALAEVQNIDNRFAEVNSLLEESQTQITGLENNKAEKTEVRLKAVKNKLEDCDEIMLAAIQGGGGTSFNLLSIPQDDSVNAKKFANKTISKNLITPYNWEYGKIVKATAGLSDNIGYDTTDFIEIPPSSQVVLSCSDSIHIAQYKADGTLYNYAGYTGTQARAGVLITTSANASKARVSIPKVATYYQLEYGTVKTDHESYNYKLKDLKLDEKAETELIEKAKVTTTSFLNPLQGKISTFNGDSICAGAGYTGGYAKIIGENNSMTVENIAVGGGTVAKETYKGDGTANHWIVSTVPNMRNDADYIILEGGVNDYYRYKVGNEVLGTITNDYNSTLDETTFCGAFESMLKQTVLKWQGKKIGFIIIHKVYNEFYPYGTATSGKFEVLYDLMVQMLNKWSIPYLDLYKNSGLNSELDVIRSAYFLSADGLHPNEAGYRQYYVPKIEAWMKTL